MPLDFSEVDAVLTEISDLRRKGLMGPRIAAVATSLTATQVEIACQDVCVLLAPNEMLPRLRRAFILQVPERSFAIQTFVKHVDVINLIFVVGGDGGIDFSPALSEAEKTEVKKRMTRIYPLEVDWH